MSSHEGHGWAQIWTGSEWIDFDGTPGNIDAFSQEVFRNARNAGVGAPSAELFAEFGDDFDPSLIIAAIGAGLGVAGLYGIRKYRRRAHRQKSSVSKEYRQIDFALHLHPDTLRACQSFMLYLLNDFQGRTSISESGERQTIFPMGWKTREEMINALSNAILDTIENHVRSGKASRTSLHAREDISVYFNSLSNPDFKWSSTHILKDETYYRNVVQGYKFLYSELERKIDERFAARSPEYHQSQQLLQLINSLVEQA